eukprot:1655-Chlamydomonas_euryale.AAC.4
MGPHSSGLLDTLSDVSDVRLLHADGSMLCKPEPASDSVEARTSEDHDAGSVPERRGQPPARSVTSCKAVREGKGVGGNGWERVGMGGNGWERVGRGSAGGVIRLQLRSSGGSWGLLVAGEGLAPARGSAKGRGGAVGLER